MNEKNRKLIILKSSPTASNASSGKWRVYSPDKSKDLKTTQIISLQTHLSDSEQIEEVSSLKIECGKDCQLKIWKPFGKIVFSESIKGHPAFSLLKSEASCQLVTKYLHSCLLKLKQVRSEELVQVLQFTKEIGCLNRLKALVGVELEKRIKKMESKELAHLLKKTNESGFREMIRWLLFSLTQKKPSEEEMETFQLPYKLLLFLPSSISDTHLPDIFSDVLYALKTRIDVSVEDKVSFQQKLCSIWKERESTGDFVVKNREDGKTQKYHKLILTSIPFFQAQSKSEMRKGSEEHFTKLSSRTFENLAKFFYLGETDHFDLLDCLELLDRENGIEFYFVGEHPLTSFLEDRMESEKMVKKENCLEVILKASKIGNQKVLKEAAKFLSENETLLKNISWLNDKEQIIVQREVMAFLLKENKLLQSFIKSVF